MDDRLRTNEGNEDGKSFVAEVTTFKHCLWVNFCVFVILTDNSFIVASIEYRYTLATKALERA